MQGVLPAIAEMDDTTVRQVRIVVLHSPRDDDPRRVEWSLSLVDVRGMAVAREVLTLPDAPVPLTDVVAPYLALVGRRVSGAWVSDVGHDGLARHAAVLA